MDDPNHVFVLHAKYPNSATICNYGLDISKPTALQNNLFS